MIGCLAIWTIIALVGWVVFAINPLITIAVALVLTFIGFILTVMGR